MKKILCVLLLAMFVAGFVYADDSIGFNRRVFNAENVYAGQSATSTEYLVGSSGYFGVWAKMDDDLDGTTILASDIDISLEQSYNGATNTWATSTTLLFDDWTDLGCASVVTVSPSPMKYMRFRAVGNSANSTATTLTMYLFRQE